MVIAVFGLPTFSVNAAPPAFAATASLAPAVRYLNDTTGSVYKFTVRNTGTTARIGGVEIDRPPSWDITSCPAPPAGWTATATSRTCKFRSAAGAAGDIAPGQSRILKVRATTRPGAADRVGTWSVTVSRTNQFDVDSELKAAAPTTSDALDQTLRSFQVTSAVVRAESSTAGDPCPDAGKVARPGSIRTIVVCGRNRANGALTPEDAQSSLSGSYIDTVGTFSSAPITPGDEAVVLGQWGGTQIVGAPGTGYKVTTDIKAANGMGYLPRTFKGYTASADDNAAPTASATSADGNEDGGAITVTLTGHDADGDALTFEAETAVNDPVTVPGSVTCDDLTPSTCTASVTYTPSPNFFGTDSFDYTVNDGTTDSAAATASITVNGVNDAPSFTKGADQTVLEDAGQQSVESWATAISAGPVDESDQALDFTVSATDPSLFTVLPAVSPTGTLTYTVGSTPGSTDVQVALQDDGGTANGGVDTSEQQSFTIDVLRDNAAPTAMATSAAGDEDGGAITVTLTGHDDDGDALTFDVGTATKGLVTVPTTVTCDGLTPSTCSTTVTYTPNGSYGGADSFPYTVDDGTTTSAPATASITVRGVNDAPSFTHKGAPTVLEDAGAQTVTGFVTSTDPGAPDESGQNVVVAVIGTDQDGMFSTPPSISADGTLTYTAAPNANGTATVTAQAWDDGGTENGGDSIGDDVTFTITVTAVNDEPSFTKGSDQTLDEDSGAQSVSNWAAAISKGPGDESAQSLSFTSSNDNNDLFAVQPGITPTGTLVFTTAPNAYGTATVSVSLSDNGGTGNGGDDTSPIQTFTITVNSVNDAPVAAAKAYTVQSNMKLSLSGLLTGATDPNDVAGDPAWSPSFTLGSITPGANCVGCTISNVSNTAGTFDFDPPAGGTGTYSITYTVRDDGSPGPGVLSAPQTITFTVNGPVVWFVDAAAGPGGTGRLSAPFNNLAAATAATGSNANQRIFVRGGNVTGNVTLPTDGWLISDAVTGTSFDAVMGITPPAGTIARPTVNSGTQRTLTGTVTLGNNSVARGLDLTPTSGSRGLVATGKTGLTVSQMSITTTGARAVDIASSSGVFNLKRVTATGADRGVSLVSTNTSTGSFTVSGTGSAGSGGVISDSTSLGSNQGGIHLADTRNVTLRWMTVSSNDSNGIYGSNVTNLVLEDSTLLNNGTQASSHFGLRLMNLFGTSAIARVEVNGGSPTTESAALIENISGSAAITVANSTFRDAANGLDVVSRDSAAVTFTSTSNTFVNNTNAAQRISSVGAQTMNVTVFGGSYTANGTGFFPISQGAGGMNFSATGGTVTGCPTCSSGALVWQLSGTGTMAGTISGLTATNVNTGVLVMGDGQGAFRVAVTNNDISQARVNGVQAWSANSSGGAKSADLTITGNTINQTAAGSQSSISVDSGRLGGDNVSMCAHIANNNITNPVASDIAVRNNYPSTTFRLPGYAGSATDTTAVRNFLLGQNTTGDATATIGAGAPGFGGGGACAAP